MGIGSREKETQGRRYMYCSRNWQSEAQLFCQQDSPLTLGPDWLQWDCLVVAHCTCMAGLAETCSHVGAVLHWVQTAVRVNNLCCTSKDMQCMAYTSAQAKYSILATHQN